MYGWLNSNGQGGTAVLRGTGAPCQFAASAHQNKLNFTVLKRFGFPSDFELTNIHNQNFEFGSNIR